MESNIRPAKGGKAMLAALIAKEYSGAGMIELKQGKQAGTMEMIVRIARPEHIA